MPLGLTDLLAAAVSARRGFGYDRFTAMASAFGLTKEEAAPLFKGPWEQRAFIYGSLLDDVMRALEGMTSPFEGMMEAPPAVNRLHRVHAARLRKTIDAARQALLEMGADLLVLALEIPAGATVTEKDLRDHGYVAPPPREDDW